MPPHDKNPEEHMKVTLLCQGKLTDGRDYWAYVEMPPSKAIAFKKAQITGGFSMQDYGDVVAWGEGKNVPQEVREQMEAEYGANHNLESQLKNYTP